MMSSPHIQPVLNSSELNYLLIYYQKKSLLNVVQGKLKLGLNNQSIDFHDGDEEVDVVQSDEIIFEINQ
mgnify:CR=1 FL=1